MLRPNILCAVCGNPRGLLALSCRFCESEEVPIIAAGQLTPYTINIEMNMPTVDEALDRFDDELRRIMGAGFRVIKVIHGHGSSGVGGKIRRAFRDAVEYNRWGHMIQDAYYGEELLPGRDDFQDLQKYHPSLIKKLSKDFFGNAGITLLLLEKNVRNSSG